ncbi:Uncharacterised protein [Mycobacteroides abscessus subsp. bolletii]|nr:Uncharacterised protein [Mycobacteroides abscessus]SKF62140.1 Uncharacterised protein [Mycobacteroides abscessus subsp. bolletii]SKH91416.1 Uncharacterised protein [Mycobacteroides abscessus subsp. bolletii]
MSFLRAVLEWVIWYAGLRRCECCHARDGSVSIYPSKGGMALCGDCATICDGRCDGVVFERRGTETMSDDPAMRAAYRSWARRGVTGIPPSTSEIASAGEALEPVKAWNTRWRGSRRWRPLPPQAWAELAQVIYTREELDSAAGRSNLPRVDSKADELLGLAQPISATYSAEEIMQILESEQQKPEKGWLRREFERARKRSESVPPHARPALIKRPRKK